MAIKGGVVMESFGKALKNARKLKNATLREVGDYIGKSIGYVSDIEHDRKRPPDLETVSKIEDFLGIKDASLMNLARKIRNIANPNLTRQIKSNPELSSVLLRASELPKDKKEKAMKKIYETLQQIEEET